MVHDPTRRSVFGFGVGARLAVAGGLAALLWLGVWWAL